MKVYLMRHFKVDFNWKKKYNSEEFDLACKMYDSNPIVSSRETLDFEVDKVYISGLSRTSETANALGLTKKINMTDLLNEVPMKSFIDTPLRLPTSIWLVFGRLQWFLNKKRQPEIKAQTLK